MLFRGLFRSCTISSSYVEQLTGIDCNIASSSSDDYQYSNLHYSVWIVFAITTVANLLIGFYINKDDNYHYRRYLQFLRLEFDTRLGMHSPR
jgi:hypothetical protein